MRGPPISCALQIILLTWCAGIVSGINPYADEEAYLKWDAMETPLDILEEFPIYMTGYDFEGRPVWIMDFYKWDLSRLVAEGEERVECFEIFMEQIRYRIYNSPLHSPQRKDEEGNIIVDSWVFLINMDRFNLKHFLNPQGMQLSLKMWAYLEVIAETLEYGFIVNTNFVAERFINALKPLIGKTLGKLSVRGTLQELWLPQVLKYIPRKVLPESYGGDWKGNYTYVH